MATEAASATVRKRRLSVAGVSSRLIEAGPEEATTALAFDLPDFGETIAAAGFEHTVPGYAAFVDAALAALGVERVYLVLHDFGGPIGLQWIAGHADRLAGLTLIDIGILPGYKWHRLARLWRTPVLGEIFQATATRPAFRFLVNRDEPRGLPRPFLEGMYDHYDRRTKRAVLKLYRATDDPGSPDPQLLAALRERGELPTLVIWGAGDAYLSSSYAERQREFFPSAEVNVLPHSGHWPFADAPEEVERLLLAFLAKA
jgi:pimeloyl-ACP methyl ester carboxylesterase